MKGVGGRKGRVRGKDEKMDRECGKTQLWRERRGSIRKMREWSHICNVK